MAQTLFTLDVSCRSFFLEELIKYFKLDIQTVNDLTSAEFKNNFPLGKTPALLGEKGFKLHEFSAIYFYLLSLLSQDQIKSFVGKNNKETALVNKWISLYNTDFAHHVFPALLMIVGKLPYNKKMVDEHLQKVEKIAEVTDARLAQYTYLATERVTFADLFVAAAISTPLSTILGKPFTKKYPNIARWFKTISVHPFFAGRFGDFQIPDTPVSYQPPKKEKKQAAPKAEAAPKAAAKPAEQPAEQAPKPKHPLEALGKASAPLDEWKRTYSNEETREVALPWFWKNQWNPEEWSLWKVDYKYNDELTLTFMSNNLVGGFFNRLSASTKYMFGCMVVYGENNNNGITGAFLVRGQEHEPAFDVAPDWESYSFTKLDASSQETRDFVDNMWAWDKPVIVNGESREIADGKVFK
jgi:elongation factor 1-gamma